MIRCVGSYGRGNRDEAEIVVLPVDHEQKGGKETHRIALQVEGEGALLLHNFNKRGVFGHVLERDSLSSCLHNTS